MKPRIIALSCLIILLFSSCTAPTLEFAKATETLPIVTSPSAAPTNPPIGTLTFALPTPTSSHQPATTTVYELYMNNGNCKLPCWWGIVPGETTLQDLQENFSIMGKIKSITRSIDKLQHYNLSFEPPQSVNMYKDDVWSFNVVIKNDIVVEIVTSAYENRLFANPTWATALTILGEPSEIWLRISPSMSNDPSDYDLVLFYPMQGYLIQGSGIAHSLTDKIDEQHRLSICPHEMPQTIDMNSRYPLLLYLFVPSQQKSFSAIDSDYSFGKYYVLLNSSISEMTPQKFYTTYSDPTATQCFNVFLDEPQ